VLAERLHPNIGKELVQSFAAFVAATRSLRLGEFENMAVAVSQRPIDVVDGQMFEFPRLIALGFRQLIEPIPLAI